MTRIMGWSPEVHTAELIAAKKTYEPDPKPVPKPKKKKGK